MVSAETSRWEAQPTNFSTQEASTERTQTKQWATIITRKIWPSHQSESQIWSTHRLSKYTTLSRTPTWWWIRTYNLPQQSSLSMRMSTLCYVKTAVFCFSPASFSNSRTNSFTFKESRSKSKPSSKLVFQDQANMMAIDLASSTAITWWVLLG
jgi:hypothetical protein